MIGWYGRGLYGPEIFEKKNLAGIVLLCSRRTMLSQFVIRNMWTKVFHNISFYILSHG